MVFFLEMNFEHILVVIVDCFVWLFDFIEGLLKCQRQQIGFEIEFECISLNIEFAGGDFDVRHSDKYLNVSVTLSKLELWYYHYYLIININNNQEGLWRFQIVSLGVCAKI